MCDFFIENSAEIWISIIGAFLGFGTALIVEAIVISHGKEEKKLDQKKELDDKVVYFTLLLREVKSSVEQQSSLIEESIELQKNDLINPQLLKRISTSFFQRIRNIDNRGVFEALSEKFKNEENWLSEYVSLNRNLDFIEGIFVVDLPRINKSTLDKGYDKSRIISEKLQYLSGLMVNFLNSNISNGVNESNSAEFSIIKEYQGLYRDFIKQGSSINFNLKKEFLNPMLKELCPFQGNIYIQEISGQCSNILIDIEYLVKDHKYTIESYRQILESLKKAMFNINDFLDKLNR